MGTDKRTFFRNLLGGLSIGAITGAASYQAASAKNAESWSPVSEPQDRWLDGSGQKHRQLFDTISPEGVARALTFTHTFYAANRDGYGLEAKDLGVLMIFRAGSTAFGFNDNIWSKYSSALAKRYKLTDPTTNAAPIVNIYNSAEKAASLPTNGLTLEALSRMGGQFAVCSVASQKLAAALAEDTGNNRDSIFREFQANLVPSARMVPAGIIAVNRAQEHQYALCYTG